MRRVQIGMLVGLLVGLLVGISGCSLLGSRSRPAGASSPSSGRSNPSGPASASGPAGPGPSSARPLPSTSVQLPSPPTGGASSPATDPSAPSSAPSSAASAGPPTSYRQAAARIAAARAATPPTGTFRTPSGNIYCSIAGGVLGCELSQGRAPAPTGYCSAGGDAGARDIGRVEFEQGRATPVCNSDTIVTPGAPTLPYGSSAGDGSIRCVSEEIGVTCVDKSSEHGFFVARGRYLVF